MGRKKVPEFWEGRACHYLAESHGKLNDVTIANKLKAEADVMATSHDEAKRNLASRSPTKRTVGRIRERTWVPLPQREKASYAYFRFPQSILGDALPMEAASAAAELLRFCLNNRRERPTVKLVQWFWTVTCFAPDAPFLKRLDCTRVLAALEVIHGPDASDPGIEAYLAFKPWRSKTDQDRYDEAVHKGKIPPWNRRIILPPGTLPETAVEAFAIFEDLPGSEIAKEMEYSKVGESGYIDFEIPEELVKNEPPEAQASV
jgi:hypothetical protein